MMVSRSCIEMVKNRVYLSVTVRACTLPYNKSGFTLGTYEGVHLYHIEMFSSKIYKYDVCSIGFSRNDVEHPSKRFINRSKTSKEGIQKNKKK